MEDREKLEHLLKHWIEHNEEHAAEYREWAIKAKDVYSGSVSNQIFEAANQIEKASESLSSAIAQMGNS